jgi:hypothetical protein
LRRPGLILLAGLVVAGCAPRPLQSDWELAHLANAPEEQEVAPPRYPSGADLIAFDVSERPGFRFFIDPASVSVGADRIVRYTLVARSPQGVDNVSFEGMRCATREYRIYAVGHEDRSWSTHESPWQTLRGSAVPPARRVLDREYFCRDLPPSNREQALAVLRAPRRMGDIGN